jgi:signal transduction histidine kinase/CheY-like chemotaxis protein
MSRAERSKRSVVPAARSGLALRTYLVLLVVFVLVPILVFAGVVFARYYDSELSRIEVGMLDDARRLALTIDQDHRGLMATLQTFAISRLIPSEDYREAYLRASKIRDITGADILVRDANTGSQVLNTRVSFGTPLPTDIVEGDDEVRRTKQPYISGVITGSVARRYVYAITVPVLDEDGQLTHFLHFSIEMQALVDLLRKNLGPGQVAGIFDRNFKYVARSGQPEQFIGEPAPPSFVQEAKADEGIWRGKDDEGTLMRGAYAHTRLAGWRVFVAVPEQSVQKSLRDILRAIVLLGALLFILAVLLAYVVGERLSRSARALVEEADALGHGAPLERRRLPVREFDDVDRELVTASINIREREEQRDHAESELRSLSSTLEKKVEERTRDLVDEMQRRIETEDALRQAQKMEAIGQLTGGVAHDFNNMLAVVLGGLDLALRRLERGDTRIQKYLTNAQEGGRRAAALTQRLLAFARQQPLEPAPLEANRLVAGMSDLLRRSLGETVNLETVLAGGLWRIHADPNQLESAIVNLAVNSRDAMPNGGKLTIETANAHLDDEYTAHQGLPMGQYVLIAVTDTGAGMPPEVASKAFDPFFTTKKSGAGTGLGLSQVYGFVKQSGGHVKIYSEMGQGTTVKIYLPRYFGEARALETDQVRAPLPRCDGSVTVLVAEDEEGVRAHAVDALEELGYTVLSAGTGKAAIELCANHPEIGLLFTDVVIPDMNGRQLAQEAQRSVPGLKVLFTTGYTRNAIVHNGMLDPDVSLLTKPFTLEQLARKIAEILKR